MNSVPVWFAGLGLLGLLCAMTALAADPVESVAGTGQPHDRFGAGFLEFRRTSGKVVGVYVLNERSPKLVDDMPGGSVTHVLYAFLHVCGPGQLPKDAQACQGRQDFQLAASDTDTRFAEAFARLKQRAPHVKVLASVGGWGGSDPFFHLVNDAARRAVFVASVVDFLRAYPVFDGVDIDWEHPTNNGSANGVALGDPADGQGYADLVQDLRKAVDQLGTEGAGRAYLVTSAVNTRQALVEKINFKDAARALDLVFMMTYDFYGPWSKAVGHHSTLFSSSADADDSLAGALRNLTQAGVPPPKLVAGVAMYGRGFTGVVAPAMGQGFTGLPKQGNYPEPEGAAFYRDIAANYLDNKGRGKAGYRVMYDQRTAAWFLYDAKTQRYMGYDDPRTVIAKGQFARTQGMAGVFAWEYSQDNGDILNAMNEGVGNVPLPKAGAQGRK
jgi:chitinase